MSDQNNIHNTNDLQQAVQKSFSAVIDVLQGVLDNIDREDLPKLANDTATASIEALQHFLDATGNTEDQDADKEPETTGEQFAKAFKSAFNL